MEELIGELREVLVEFGFTQRWAEIEKWWMVGKTIHEFSVRPSDIPTLADELEVEPADLWDAILFYKKYPDLTLFPEGKNASWDKIRESL
ncbi:MAG: hypothetical protein KatS3mg101_1000 [Patescibacteria group bacterium]|nr:MAG: hypothetical protein KatS3mg101_1000 [Patescibacteria group bacterium]